MKKQFFLPFLVMLLFLGSCATQKASDTHPVQTKTQQDDDGQWELTVFDSDFQYFLNTRAKPKSMYTLSYLKAKNQALAAEWNAYYASGRYRNIVESNVDYDPNEKYGFDFQYKLFQVFVYTAWKYHLPLYNLPRSERAL